MEHDTPDSSGTDDDLHRSHPIRGGRGGRITGNGRTDVFAPHPRIHNDMETQVHRLEQEAYSSVLRAFKAQSDAITWEKESLITELRKELRVSDEEHRELLNRVNADEIIHRIREWRQGGGFQSILLNKSQPVHDQPWSPTVSASRKRKTRSLLGTPNPALHSQGVITSMQPSSTTGIPGVASGTRDQTLAGVSSMKFSQYPSTDPSGRDQYTSRTGAATEPAEGAAHDPLIGRKVMTRWPEDNNFYEAVITDYNPREGRHALVYDVNANNVTWEWVNLKEISPEDIRWVGSDPGIIITHQTAAAGGSVLGAGRGRGSAPPSQNGNGTKGSLDMETLMIEVERILGAVHPDRFEMARIKKMLKEREQSLIDAISRLASGESSEEDKDPLPREQQHGLREPGPPPTGPD